MKKRTISKIIALIIAFSVAMTPINAVSTSVVVITPPVSRPCAKNGTGVRVQLMAREAVDWITTDDGIGPWRGDSFLVCGDGTYTTTINTPGGYDRIIQLGLYSTNAVFDPLLRMMQNAVSPNLSALTVPQRAQWSDAMVTFNSVVINGTHNVGITNNWLDANELGNESLISKGFGPTDGFVYINLWNGWHTPHQRLTTGVEQADTVDMGHNELGEPAKSFRMTGGGAINTITVTFTVAGTGIAGTCCVPAGNGSIVGSIKAAHGSGATATVIDVDFRVSGNRIEFLAAHDIRPAGLFQVGFLMGGGDDLNITGIATNNPIPEKVDAQVFAIPTRPGGDFIQTFMFWRDRNLAKGEVFFTLNVSGYGNITIQSIGSISDSIIIPVGTPPVLTTSPPVLTTEPVTLNTSLPEITTQPVTLNTSSPGITTQPVTLNTSSPEITTQPVTLNTSSPAITTQPVTLTTSSLGITASPAATTSATTPPSAATDSVWCYNGCGKLQAECACDEKVPVPGDVDGNGVVTILDALEILMKLAGLESVAPDDVTINDALDILMHLAGMPSDMRIYG
jgi:hypothetical protein